MPRHPTRTIEPSGPDRPAPRPAPAPFRASRRTSAVSLFTSCVLHLTLASVLWLTGAFEVTATEARPTAAASEESAIRIRFVPRERRDRREEVPRTAPDEIPLGSLAPPERAGPRPFRSIARSPLPETRGVEGILPPIHASPLAPDAGRGRDHDRATPDSRPTSAVLPPVRPAADSVRSRSAPVRLDRVAPEYPERCLERRHEGIVDLVLSVDAEGRVTAVRVTDPSGCPDLDAAARKAALGLRYEPASENGRPVAGEAALRVRFVLEDPL